MPTAKIKNTTAYARTGIVTLGVPFTRGFDLQDTETLVVNNALTGYTNQQVQWYPVGVRWDSGAVKYARVSFKADLTSEQEKTVSIGRSGTANTVPFILSTPALVGLLGTSISLTIEGTAYQFPVGDFFSNPSLKIEGAGAADHYGRYRYFTHLPANSDPKTKYLWMDLVIDLHSGLDYIPFFVRFGYYRFYSGMPNSQGVSPRFDITQIVQLRITGARSKIRWEEYKIPTIDELSSTDRRYNLINPTGTDTRFPFGCSHCYKGVLAYGSSDTISAELGEQILAMAEDWKYTYPITGIQPSRPSYITDDADALNRSNSLLNTLQSPVKAQRSPYNWPTTTNNPDCRQAGAHGARDYAYGLRGLPFMGTTNYNWVPFLEFCTRQQAVRHNWFYQDDGEPVTPAQYRASGTNGVAFWNGTYFSLNSYYSLAGFSREMSGDSDVPWAVGAYGAIFGPDKEHFTNKMFVLQGFVTMDWFSLEYAKMYSKYWIQANRNDSPSGSISSWGSPRATGRTYEVAAYLYEFYGDPELKTWIKSRTTYNLLQPSTFFLDKSVYPGGTEMIRATAAITPCGQGSCLNTLHHWRPWEEGACVLGTYLMAKCLLSEDPADTQGLRLLEMSRDTSGSILMKGGWLDGRTSSTRRFLTLSFPSSAACNTFKDAIGTMGAQQPLTNVSTGGTGTIYMYYHNPDGGTAEWNMSRLIVHLKNASGSFAIGNTIRLATGPVPGISEPTVLSISDFAGGAKSRYIGSPSLSNWGIGHSESEEDELMPLGQDPGNFSTTLFPVSYTKYAYWYYLYTKVMSAALPIAREAAQQGFYADSNSAIISRATDYITWFRDSGFNTDNGDYQEDFLCFAGYLVPSLLDTSYASVVATPANGVLTLPAPTAVIQNNQSSADVSVTCSSSTLTVEATRVVTATTNGTADVSVSCSGSRINVASKQTSASIWKSVTMSSSIITVDSQESISIYTTSSAPGVRVLTYIYLGEPEAYVAPAFVHENPPEDPVAN